MTDKIIKPTPRERAYNKGWKEYFKRNGDSFNANPYDPEDDPLLYESFEDGWLTADRVESEPSEE